MVDRAPVLGNLSLLNRLSSGTKMLFIMTVALMPLGLIALFASIQSANAKQLQHQAEARVIASAEARQIELVVLRGANVIRVAAAGADAAPWRCDGLLADARRVLRDEADIALFSRDGRPLCRSEGFAPTGLVRPASQIGMTIELLDRPGRIRFTVGTAGGGFAVGEYGADALRTAMAIEDERQGVSLAQGDIRLQLFSPAPGRALDHRITLTAPIAGGQVRLLVTTVIESISAVEVLLVLLPLLMWAAAAVIGWIVVNELLLRPLGQLQRAVGAAGATGVFTLPRLSTPAREIRELAQAFGEATEQIAHREGALSDAFDRQVKLTREVHHRVKNNLQVVASLINLHARGTAGDVASAYASIQRRVDALAIVHRNHYAELEENRGVALRSLMAELTSNLRATAPAAASHMAIRLDMVPAHISQDVAVPIAFLVTEIVELVMQCSPAAKIDVALAYTSMPDRALFSIAAPSLALPECVDHPGRDRFERIIAGLARQLRAPLQAEQDTGRYAISIAIVPDDEHER